MRCLFAFAAVAVAVSAATAQTPPASADNIRLSFTQHGLNEVLALGSELVYDALKGGVTLPDIHIDTHVAEPLGHITLDLTDIQASWLIGWTGVAAGARRVCISKRTAHGCRLRVCVFGFVRLQSCSRTWCVLS